MNKALKYYESLNDIDKFFTPIVDVAKDGIVTVSNLGQIHVGNIVKSLLLVNVKNKKINLSKL